MGLKNMPSSLKYLKRAGRVHLIFFRLVFFFLLNMNAVRLFRDRLTLV